MSPNRSKPPEILLVEDSETDAQLVQRALAQSDRASRVSVLTDGEQAMAYLHGHVDAARPDLVLLDLNLPKMNGWEVLAQCKTDPVLRSIPVVVFTTSEHDKDVRRCYELGANSYVSKPFELAAFMDAIRSIEDYWLGVSAPPMG